MKYLSSIVSLWGPMLQKPPPAGVDTGSEHQHACNDRLKQAMRLHSRNKQSELSRKLGQHRPICCSAKARHYTSNGGNEVADLNHSLGIRHRNSTLAWSDFSYLVYDYITVTCGFPGQSPLFFNKTNGALQLPANACIVVCCN